MKQIAKINRCTVNSSSLAAIAYDSATSTLDIEFTSGAAYRYINVAAEAARELIAAPSLGRYFVTEIKGRYPYTRLETRKK